MAKSSLKPLSEPAPFRPSSLPDVSRREQILLNESIIRLSPSRADSEKPGLRLYANAVADGSTDSLLAAEITFGRLHGNVSEKKLDLVEFSPGGMAQLSAERRRS